MIVQTLPQVIRQRAEQAPDDELLIFLYEDKPAQHITNQQLHHDALHWANLLHNYGVSTGEVVLLLFDHTYELVQAFWGALYLGAIPSIFAYFSNKTTVDAYTKRLSDLIDHAQIETILTTSYWSTILPPHLPHCHVLSLEPPIETTGSTPFPTSQTTPQDPAFLQFSSGTTGFPKGILLSHQAVFNSVTAMTAAMTATSDDVSITWAPFYHEMGLLLGFLMPLIIGAKAVLISPFHWVKSPAILFQAITRYGGTSSWMPNFGFDLCVRRIQDHELDGVDLSHLRLLGNGSEPVRADTLQRFADRFSPYGYRPEQLLTAYGMAENVVLITTSQPGTPPPIDTVSAQALQRGKATPVSKTGMDAVTFVSNGRSIPHAQLIIVDETGTPLPDRYVGQIVIRTNSLFHGYYLRPDLTESALKEGWLYTGDLGYLVAGELYICERKKDLIIAGGQNIYPDSIEAITQTVLGDYGARVVAFGIYQEAIGTEVPTLLCELRQPVDATQRRHLLQTIRQQVLQQLDVALGDVRFVPKGWIQRTTSGKLARRANRDHYLATYFEADTVTHHGDLSQTITTLVENALNIRPISLERNIFELGFDSLRFMALFAQIETHIAQPIPITPFLEHPTIAHMVALLEGTETPPKSTEMLTIKPQPISSGKARPIWQRRIWRRTYINGLDTTRLPYGLTSRLLWWLANQRGLQQFLFKREKQLLEASITAVNATNSKAILQHSLASNTWKKWRLASLSHPATFKKWVKFEGLDHLETAFTQQRGVILIHNHSALRRLFSLLPSHLCPTLPTFTIGATRPAHLQQNGFEQWAQMKQQSTVANETILTAQLYLAQQTLQQGGLVQLMGDGLRGQQGITVNFWGRKRPFRFGIAYLALTTNAIPIPTFMTLKRSGHIHITFHPPLLSSGHDITTQMTEMMQQYSQQLSQYWQQELGTVSWRQLIRVQKLPYFDEPV